MEEIFKILIKNGIKPLIKRKGEQIIKDNVINAGYNAMYRKKAELINKVSTEIATDIEGIKDIPGQMFTEIRRQSVHENTRQPFSEYDYFGSYYQSQNNRYNPTPVNNLAECLRAKENMIRRLRGL